MLHNHLELMRGKMRHLPMSGRKVTGKHDDLQEIAYETFWTGVPVMRRRDSCRMLVTNKVSGQMGVWEHTGLGWMTNDQSTNIIKMIQKYSQLYLQYNSIS